jgi:ankyrin repeat protein
MTCADSTPMLLRLHLIEQALHWAAKNGNMLMLSKLLECGASAPYHRLLREAKLKGKKIVVCQGSVSNSEGKKTSEDQVQSADENDENPSNDTSSNGLGDDSGILERSTTKSGPISQTEVEDEEDIELFLETSSNLLMNTPLQWATVKGHLRAVWLLLLDGYSPNDRDHLGNNSLHLAAVNGHLQILKVLVEDGGRANIVNIYKNLPIDMATGIHSFYFFVYEFVRFDVRHIWIVTNHEKS